MNLFSVLLLLLISSTISAGEPVYIDVRTWVEHQVDNIDGDERIHVSEILDGVESRYPDKSTPIRLYCARGVRAQTAMDRLKAAGYTDVQNLGGIDDARKLRFSPVEQ